ncbi:MAG: hypothetical protein KIT36_10050 [Alphaproteobacteria bacterium]|nr:hypothetical protein [Alphaproteobacteria bacterium]
MPIEKADVLAVLGDPMLRRIHFSVGPINVNSSEYDKVADYIGADAIQVKPGRSSVAIYLPQINTLRTRRGEPPLGLDARTNLVHECTHAISDINKCNVTRMTDEAAAYLAQIAYLLLLDPSITEPPIGLPIDNMSRLCMKLIDKYRIGRTEGLGAMISHDDVADLARLVHAIPDYANIRENEKLAADGVSLSDDEAQEFYRLQLSRFMSQNMSRMDAEDVAQMLTTKVRGVAYENYVTWDPELLELAASYVRGGAAQKRATQQKLLRIFLTIDQSSATRLLRRLSPPSKGDALSERFNSGFPLPARTALLSALQLSR